MRPAVMPTGFAPTQQLGSPYGGHPGYPPPMPPAPRKGLSTRVLVTGIVVLLALTSVMISAVLAPGASAPLVAPEISLPPSPGPDDPPQVRQEWLMAVADLELDNSAQALLDDDEDGWLAVYDSSIHDAMSERFGSLRALAVSFYEYRIISHHPIENGPETFELRLAATYCLGGEVGGDCAGTSILFDTTWSSSDDDVRIIDVEDSYEMGPRPFEVEKLQAKVGERAIVAAPSKYADELDNALQVAEEAAENADQYAVYGAVDRYIVFLAGDDEFGRWYGDLGDMTNVVGFAIPLTLVDDRGGQEQGGSEVVVHADRVHDETDFVSTMRHELGHVATLHHSPDHQQQPEEWWLAEGSAELIDHGPENSVDGYLRQYDVEEYIDRKLWDGDISAATPSDDLLAGSAKYGIAFYCAYYLFTEYGKDKFMDFFGKVARDGEDAESASQEVYAMPYSDLEDEMTDFVKSTAG